jgi:uncharacterized membrane protein
MAGIGFVLRRVVTESSSVGVVKGYLAAAIVAAGPWLLSVATMATLGVISSLTLQADDQNVLFGSILYVYAFSLIGIGPVQLVITRFVADKVYLEQRQILGSACVTVVAVTLAVLYLPAAAAILEISGLPLPFRLAMLALFVGSAGTWLAMIFLSAAKNYGFIVLAFTAGYGVGLVAALLAGPRYGPTGYLAGFTAGQMVVFGILVAGALREFDRPTGWRLDAFGYLRKYPSLLLVGLGYNLGIWVDKLVFWYAPTGITLMGPMHAYPPYDRAMFLSSLAIVPALTVFVLRVETDFYVAYKTFFDGIEAKATLSTLRQAREGMQQTLRSGFMLLLKVQTITVLVSLLLAPHVAALVGLEPGQLGLLPIGLLANSTEVVLLVSLLGLLYFDQRRAAAMVASTFLVGNVVLTLVTVQLGEAWYGLGYLGASLISLTLAQGLLWRHLADLEYHTFTGQPGGQAT